MASNLKDKLSNRLGTSPIATCTLRIRSHYNALSPVQKKLADYITASREVLPALDLKQLARKAKVSSATVTRFCRAIGFAGFHEFKMASAQELVSLPLVFEDFDPSDDDESRISKVFAAYIQSLIDTRAILSVPHLTELADRIKRARQVSVFGIGSSGSMAVAASHRLALLGVPCQAHTDPYEQTIAAALLTGEDVAIGISHSGTSRITVDTMRLARKQGAFTVAITNHANSPLARVVSLSLLTSLHERKVHVASLTSRVAQLTLVDCLYITLAARNEKKFTTLAALIEKELRGKIREFPRSAE
jgi:RpiR family transcriptional regulator, carbohydrate utilization regulator